MKKKRIVTKIGHVFCIEIDTQYKCYFQYICNDMSQLNSSVIRVFKKRYPMDSVPVIDDIVKDEVSFYAHTILRSGIADGAWYKVGKSMNLGLNGLETVYFASTLNEKHIWHGRRLEIVAVDPLENWWIWKINQDRIFVGTLPDVYAEEGAVSPYPFIIQRIKDGFVRSWGYSFYNN